MKKSKDSNNEIEAAFEAISKLKKVKAPDNIYHDIVDKMERSGSAATPYNYLKYAAIGLLILINTLSYRAYQKQAITSSEFLLSDLVLDYELIDERYENY